MTNNKSVLHGFRCGRLIKVGKLLFKALVNTTFLRGFGFGVVVLSLFAWYLQGLYSQLTETGYSWMFFIHFSITFITFSWLLEKKGVMDWKNVVYSLLLVFGLNAIGDTIWIILNDAFVRHLFDNGFRLGWFVTPHMRRNLILSVGLIGYALLLKKRIMKVGISFILSLFLYVVMWSWYVSIGCPDWRQPNTLIILDKFQAFIVQQFIFRILTNLVFTSLLLDKSLFKLKPLRGHLLQIA